MDITEDIGAFELQHGQFFSPMALAQNVRRNASFSFINDTANDEVTLLNNVFDDNRYSTSTHVFDTFNSKVHPHW